MNTLGMRIKERREAKGWTQEQFAKEIKASRSTVGDYETGRKSPRYDRLDLIANVLGTSTDYLLGRTDNPAPTEKDKLDLGELLKSPNVTYKGKEIPAKDLDLFIDLADRILDHLEKKKH
jgi:transcriptional regulator with XRE-family HTH domain